MAYPTILDTDHLSFLCVQISIEQSDTATFVNEYCMLQSLSNQCRGTQERGSIRPGATYQGVM